MDLEMFQWWKKRRRKKILAQPSSQQFLETLDLAVLARRNLSGPQIEKLIDLTKVFVAEKQWEPSKGFAITEEMKIFIAAQACLMILSTVDYYFDGVQTVVVFPHAFPRKSFDGLVMDETGHHSGEAWKGGPIILSWRDTYEGANFVNGHNVVIHEFAHHIDGLDGEMGGSPPFDNSTDAKRWHEILKVSFEDLWEAAEEGTPTLINHYGATNHQEFFAVVTETFFELPHQLRKQHPELFQLLVKFYKLDPTNWY